MAYTLAEIRAKLKAQEEKKEKAGSGGFKDKTVFPFWDMKDNESTTVRFLPDGNEQNGFFWVERQLIKLPFSGIKGDASSKPVTIQVPCIEMWDEKASCPIHAELRSWYKSNDEDLKKLASQYWKKRSFFYQGFVRQTTVAEQELPENPIRRFIFNTQIQPIIRAALMDQEIMELPTDYSAGLDFILSKTPNGQYSAYTTSRWSRRESALTDVEIEAIQKYGLLDLSSFLPEKPSEEKLAAMMKMFEDSVAGLPYDLEQYGQFFKPFGSRDNDADGHGDSQNTARVESKEQPTPTPTPAPVATQTQQSAPAAAPASGSAKAQAILASIRKTQAA